MNLIRLQTLFLLIPLNLFAVSLFAKSGPNTPEIKETEHGRILVVPDDVVITLESEFPGSHIPEEIEFDPKMLQQYHNWLIGIHPAITWGDFNADKKRDYAVLLVTGETPWGPLVELVILNGLKKKGQFETFRLGEVYNFNIDYLRYKGGKLYKGKLNKGGWHINWDPKKSSYNVEKS